MSGQVAHELAGYARAKAACLASDGEDTQAKQYEEAATILDRVDASAYSMSDDAS